LALRIRKTRVGVVEAVGGFLTERSLIFLQNYRFVLSASHSVLLVGHRRAGNAAVAELRGANEVNRLTDSGGRLHLGMVARIKSESSGGFAYLEKSVDISTLI
jgi:hypothetical protein